MTVAIVRLRAAAVAAGLALAACGGASPTGPSYTVSYRLSATGPVTFDSVIYADAKGTLVKVTNPTLPWSVVLSESGGSWVEASAYGTASGGSMTATLEATWTQSGVSTASDSSTAAISAPGGFALDIPPRQI